jgi:hypothetical protein
MAWTSGPAKSGKKQPEKLYGFAGHFVSVKRQELQLGVRLGWLADLLGRIHDGWLPNDLPMPASKQGFSWWQSRYRSEKYPVNGPTTPHKILRNFEELSEAVCD